MREPTRWLGSDVFCFPAWLAVIVVMFVSCGPWRSAAAGAVFANSVIKPAGEGGFQFDTGELRGKIAVGGRALGMTEVVDVRTGARLDGSNGLLSHYRVFTRGRRYGGGAWDWPCRIRQLNGTSVEILWEPEPERQFEMRSRYEFVSPTTVELRTTVVSSVRLEGFEVFLASYFSSGFTNSMVLVKEGGESGEKPSLRRAVKSGGDWQMFVRGDAERKVVSDGRWKLPPNPVEWVVYPLLAKPVAIRHAQALGLGAVLVGDEEECFAVATPHETEGHYSVYLCLWGRDIEPGKQTSAQTRLVFVPGDANTVGMAALAECGGGNGR